MNSFFESLSAVLGIYIFASLFLAALFLLCTRSKNYKFSQQQFFEWGLKGSAITGILFTILYLLQYQGSIVWTTSSIFVILSVLITYIFTEMVLYVLHFSCHKIQGLWIFHKKHHAIKIISFTNSVVDSFVFQLASAASFLTVTLILKIPILSLVIAYSFWRVILALSHLDKPISYGIMGYIFLDPKKHLEHHFDRNNKDYAVTLRLLDYAVRYFV